MEFDGLKKMISDKYGLTEEDFSKTAPLSPRASKLLRIMFFLSLFLVVGYTGYLVWEFATAKPLPAPFQTTDQPKISTDSK